MVRRFISLALCLMLLGSVTAYAAESRALLAYPSLTFNGITANCYVQVTKFGNGISVNLELWQGNNFIDGWSASGNSYVVINETCAVESGKTYRLVVTGTAGTESISGSVSGKCP